MAKRLGDWIKTGFPEDSGKFAKKRLSQGKASEGLCEGNIWVRRVEAYFIILYYAKKLRHGSLSHPWVSVGTKGSVHSRNHRSTVNRCSPLCPEFSSLLSQCVPGIFWGYSSISLADVGSSAFLSLHILLLGRIGGLQAVSG